jgi:hypothetical protein
MCWAEAGAAMSKAPTPASVSRRVSPLVSGEFELIVSSLVFYLHRHHATEEGGLSVLEHVRSN